MAQAQLTSQLEQELQDREKTRQELIRLTGRSVAQTVRCLDNKTLLSLLAYFKGKGVQEGLDRMARAFNTYLDTEDTQAALEERDR